MQDIKNGFNECSMLYICSVTLGNSSSDSDSPNNIIDVLIKF